MIRSILQKLQTRRVAMVAVAAVMALAGILVATPETQAANTNARVLWESRKDTRTLELTVNSASADGPMKTVRLLLPQGWTKNSSKKYPTLWLLHGGMDDSNSWLKGTDIRQMVASRNMMVVMPDTSWCSAYSDWQSGSWGYDSAWETYLTRDLRNLLHDKYGADRSNAAVAGPSMGGLGALKLAQHHPDMFKAAVSFSGNVDPLHAYNNMADGPDLPGLSCAADWKRVWGDYRKADGLATWQRNDPYVQAHLLAQQKYVYVSSGDGQSDPLQSEGGDKDMVEQGVYKQARAIVEKLEGLNIPVDSHFYAGNHTWTYWNGELQRAFPGILDALGVE